MRYQRISQEGLSSCRYSMKFPVDQKTTKKNAWQMPNSYLCTRDDLEKDNGHSLALVLRKSGTLSVRTVHKESGTISRRRCCWNSPKADVRFPVPRPHCPEVNSEAKDMENCRFTLLPLRKNWGYFSHNYLCKSAQSLRSSREMCEEYESLHDGSGRPDRWWDNQLCSVKSRQKFFWIVMTQRIKIFYRNNMMNELKNCHNKINFCMDAGFLNVVGVGQYLITKDIAEFSQFHAVACREYTLTREEAPQPVEVLCTTPHIYEQKTAQTMATSRTCLSTSRWSTLTLACTWSRTTLRPEHLSTDH